jgi:hypothetical protein
MNWKEKNYRFEFEDYELESELEFGDPEGCEHRESDRADPEFDSIEIEERRFSLKHCYLRDTYSCPIADRCNYEPAERCICCGNLMVETFRDEGYFATRIGRAVAVAFPGYLKMKDGMYWSGLKVIVYSDPDSGIDTRKDEFLFVGHRYGLYDVFHNGHSIFGGGYDGTSMDSASFLLTRLNSLIASRDFYYHPLPLSEEERKRCHEMIMEMAEILGVKMKEDSYLPPKKILVVSAKDSCVGPIVKAYIKFITRYDDLYIESAAFDDPSDFDENARKAITEILGEEFADHTPQWIKEVEVIYEYDRIYGCKTLLDHDLIIAVEERFLKDLPKDRTVTLKEIVEDYMDVKEPKTLEECKDFIKDLRKNYINIINNIYDLVGREEPSANL